MTVTRFNFVLTSFLFLAVATVASAQWVPCAGPFGGNVQCFAVDDTTFFAGTSGGLFESTDNAKSWSATDSGLILGENGVTAITTIGNVLVAGTDSGLFRSMNHGMTWRNSPAGTPGKQVNALFAVGSIVLLGNYEGSVFRSTDSGNTWSEVSAGALGGDFHSFAMNGNILFEASGSSIFRSKDSGKTWVTLSHPGNGSSITSLCAIGNVLLEGTPILGISRSLDSGETWQSTADSLAQFWYGVSLVNFAGKVFAGIINRGIFYSTDRGTTWSASDIGWVADQVHTFFASGGTLLAGTNGGGVISTVDTGKTWKDMSGGLLGTEVDALISSNGRIYSATDGAGCFVTSDAGSTWESANTGLTNPYLTSLATEDTSLFVGSFGDGVFRADRNTPDWKAVDSGVTNPYISALGAFPFALFEGSTMQQHLASRSINNGIVWEPSDSGMQPQVDWGAEVYSFGSIGPNLFAGTNGGMYESMDSGAFWEPAYQEYLGDAFAFCTAGTTIFAGSGSGVFQSDDSGSTWTARNSGLTNTNIRSFALQGTSLFAGTWGGVFLTTISGSSWQNVSLGLPSTPVLSLAIGNGYLLAGTLSSGVWKRPLSEMIAPQSVSSTDPNPAVAADACPNPFTESSNIEFFTVQSTYAHVTIENILGNSVAQLFDGELPAGEHSFAWNAENVPDGIYFAVIHEGNSVQRVALSLAR